MPRYFSELCEVVGPPRILRHRANESIAFRDFTITTNGLGLRGPDLSKVKPANERRLVFLGDSVVLGWGVDLEEHFLSLAEQELNASAQGEWTYRCINTGHNQYDTTQEYALLEELGEALSPDAVMLVYVNNDVHPTLRTYEALLKQAKEGIETSAGWFTRAKRAALNTMRSVFKGTSNLLALLFHAKSVWQELDRIQHEESKLDAEGWTASRDALLKIRDWCEARDIPFMVLNHTLPEQGGLPAQVPPLLPFLEAEKIPCHPFYFTVEEMKRPLRHSFSDAHANALGHELLLEKLRPMLRELRKN
jgi:lysophospholipase L1-like esterase